VLWKSDEKKVRKRRARQKRKQQKQKDNKTTQKQGEQAKKAPEKPVFEGEQGGWEEGGEKKEENAKTRKTVKQEQLKDPAVADGKSMMVKGTLRTTVFEEKKKKAILTPANERRRPAEKGVAGKGCGVRTTKTGEMKRQVYGEKTLNRGNKLFERCSPR